MDYFAEAASIARAHEANRQHDTAMQRCIDSFRKQHAAKKARGEVGGFTYNRATADAQELALFDAAEALAINSGKGGF